VGFGDSCKLGELLLATAAVAEGGSATSLGVAAGETVLPDPGLTRQIGEALAGDWRSGPVASFDAHPEEQAPSPEIVAADMQTASLLARARSLGIEAAAILIAAETAASGKVLEKDALEVAEKRAGRAAATALSV
jgi:uridine phosphorylase